VIQQRIALCDGRAVAVASARTILFGAGYAAVVLAFAVQASAGGHFLSAFEPLVLIEEHAFGSFSLCFH
jgi:hypothetical protein